MLIRGSSFLWVLLVHHPHAIAPALIHLHQRPLDARREVAQQNVAGRMYSQRRSDQKQKRRWEGFPATAEPTKKKGGGGGGVRGGEISLGGEIPRVVGPRGPPPGGG